MKRFLCILLALCLTACGAPAESSGASKGMPDLSRLEEELKGSASKQEEKNPYKKTDKLDAILSGKLPQKEPQKQEEKPSVLQLEKTLLENYKWSIDYDVMLVDSIRTFVTLREEERENYPQLAQVLDELGESMEQSTVVEFEALVAYAEEDVPTRPDRFETYIDRTDFQVRRADSSVLSLAMDVSANFAGIGIYRSVHGMNYDSRSGETLQLSDVITDKADFVSAVEAELQGGMWTGELYSENAISLFFEHNEEEDYSWTLDYNGVTMFFNPNEIAEQEYGMIVVTVPFAKYPNLFQKKYQNIPDSYIVELGKSSTFFTDLDGDGDCEELIAVVLGDDGLGFCSNMGLYTADSYYEQDFLGYRVIPYYVRTAEGENLIYLSCCSSFLGDFWAYTVNDGIIHPIGRLDASLHMVEYGENRHSFSLLTDPTMMYLDDYNDPTHFYGPNEYGEFVDQGGVKFEAAANGLPRRWDKMMPDVDVLSLSNLSEELVVGEHMAYLSINPYDANPHFHPWIDPQNDDVEQAALHINADGTGTIIDFDNREDELRFRWYVDTIHSYRLECEDGSRFYLSCYSGQEQGSPECWLLLNRESDNYQLWFIK